MNAYFFQTFRLNKHNIFKFKKSNLGLRNVFSKKNFNHKQLSSPMLTIFSGFFLLYLEEKLKLKSTKILSCKSQGDEKINENTLLNPLLRNKFIVIEEPKIYIIYDEENDLQAEMSDLILNNLQQNYFNTQFDFDLSNKITIQKLSLKQIKENDDFNKITKYFNIWNIKNKNEPLVLINNQIIGEFINPYSLSTNINDKTKIKLNNLLAYEKIQNLKELREEFRYLENPKQTIVLINSDDITDRENSYIFNRMISVFRDKNTKFLLVSDSKLKNYLNMEKGHIYKYYSNKLPYKAKDPDMALEEYFYNSENSPYSLSQSQKLPIHEILTKEGIDLNSYMSSNNVALSLKFNLFRDKIKIDKDLFQDNSNLVLEGEGEKGFILKKHDRIKFQKLISYPHRNVIKLGETDKKIIQHQWTLPNKHFLYIHVPTWVYLKENIFDNILFESSHLFDGVQISNSTNFSYKNGLYDDSQISGELPQIFIIETGDNPSTDRKVYSMNYFRFADDFNKYLKNRKELFKKQEVIDNFTYVQTVNSKSFEEKILKDNSFDEFMIEIKHEGCPTCYMLGKMFDHVSQKFYKHGYLKNFRFFRVDTHNDLPFLGEFAATPTYLFCRKKEDGQIGFISQIEKHEFIFKLRKLSKYDFSKARYHPNIGFGFYLFQRQEFLKPNYDPDVDLGGFS